MAGWTNRDRISRIYAEGPDIVAASPDADTSAAVARPDVTLGSAVETLFTTYADRPALGERATRTVDGSRELLDSFETISYGEVWSRAKKIAAAWHANHVGDGSFVATLGFSGIDYTVLDIACIYAGAVSVPLQPGAPVATLRAIVAETQPSVLAVSVEMLATAAGLLTRGHQPQQVIVFDYDDADSGHRSAVQDAQHLPIVLLNDLQRSGAPEIPIATTVHDDIRLLIYTSGSTGTPKGAIYTGALVKALWVNQPPFAAINVNFAPMSHILARLSLCGVLGRGGTAYFTAKSDLSALFGDIAAVRPTELVLVPRICDMIYQRFLGEVERRAGTGDRTAVEAVVKTHLREHFLGGRVMSAISGSAPLAPEMKQFIESVLGLALHDGYGSTEAGGGVIYNNVVRRPPVIDYRLADVPELGYFATDKPHPRGELLLKTTTMFPGYFKRPEITAEVFDADGFYRTGDVVAELGPDRLAYVDRRNNVQKLSQGEFVTVAKVEAALGASALIRQIYVYGNSERAYLLAVIVPADPGTGRAELIESLQATARGAQLQPYEIPRDFLVETEAFSAANGLLSGIGKLLRPNLKQRYGDRLEQLYADLARAQNDDLIALRKDAAKLPVQTTVIRAAAAVLGCAPGELRPDAQFVDLGGDSLSALSLSTLLQDIFGVEVPVGTVTSPATDLAALAGCITATGNTPTAATVHAEEGTIRASELTLEKFIDPALLSAAADLPLAGAPGTVLLTGASGYLGRFLCLDWLHKADRVVCIVRGKDAADARRRLLTAYDTDASLVAELAALDTKLEVVVGDLSAPSLGLDDHTWTRLAAEADLVVHSAALVNHVLPYRQLFAPNVAATAEIIRLALTTKRKPIDFLSTVAVAAQVRGITEDADIREISPVRSVDAGYANGYGNSKWAAEVLLREAHERCGLPVAVFRSDMILAHTRYAGQLNMPDIFTRLLLSLLLTGIAPGSFYASGGDRAHYEGLPVDFTSATVAGLSAAYTAGHRGFHLVNPHDDGISLDTFVDWLIADGHDLRRIEDYTRWRDRFETSLRALGETARNASVLPLLHAYARPARAVAGSPLPTDRLRATGLDIPHLDAELIAKYAADLRARGLLR